MTKKKNENALELKRIEGESDADAMARIAMNSPIRASFSIKQVSSIFEGLDFGKIATFLEQSIAKVNKNDLSELEGMLVNQAKTLDALFHSMFLRANNSEYMTTFQPYFNLALKCQNQSRMTIQTLAEMKNPHPYIQNNRAEYQQVNNGERRQSGDGLRDRYARAEENSKSTNGVLEDKRHETEWLDTGAPQETSGNDKDLEALGAQHRAEDG